jgi:hypothetical protein
MDIRHVLKRFLGGSLDDPHQEVSTQAINDDSKELSDDVLVTMQQHIIMYELFSLVSTAAEKHVETLWKTLAICTGIIHLVRTDRASAKRFRQFLDAEDPTRISEIEKRAGTQAFIQLRNTLEHPRDPFSSISNAVRILAEVLDAGLAGHSDNMTVITELFQQLGPEAEDAVPALVRALRSEPVAAAQALAAIGPDARHAGKELVRVAYECHLHMIKHIDTTNSSADDQALYNRYYNTKEACLNALRTIFKVITFDISKMSTYDRFRLFVERQWKSRVASDDDKPLASARMDVNRVAVAVDAVLDTVPPGVSYVTHAEAWRKVSHDFRSRLAEHVAPILNATIKRMPQDTLEDKKAICEFVNGELEPLGIAVICPNTDGLPGKLKATTGHWPGKGRFHFEVYIDGQLKKPAASDTLPVLELTDAYPSKKLGTHFQGKVGPKANQTGRKL